MEDVMDKATAMNQINDVFGLKSRATESVEALSLLTLSAKSMLANDKAAAMTTADYKALTNDKTRDGWLLQYCETSYVAVDMAAQEEREARHKLALLDLEVDRLRMIVKINCEWQE
jgi:hypothetical protein